MKKLWRTVLGLGIAVAPIWAHHSFAAEYDDKKSATLKGTISKVEWVNPHVRLLLDVKDESGKVTTWELEFGAPNILLRRGIGRNTVKVGDVVTIDGWPAKDGANLVAARTITLPDGRKVSQSGDEGNQK